MQQKATSSSGSGSSSGRFVSEVKVNANLDRSRCPRPCMAKGNQGGPERQPKPPPAKGRSYYLSRHPTVETSSASLLARVTFIMADAPSGMGAGSHERLRDEKVKIAKTCIRTIWRKQKIIAAHHEPTDNSSHTYDMHTKPKPVLVWSIEEPLAAAQRQGTSKVCAGQAVTTQHTSTAGPGHCLQQQQRHQYQPGR